MRTKALIYFAFAGFSCLILRLLLYHEMLVVNTCAIMAEVGGVEAREKHSVDDRDATLGGQPQTANAHRSKGLTGGVAAPQCGMSRKA